MPADRTLGNYVLGAMLGRGGMSEVYAAEHRFLGDRVAIKLLRAHFAGNPGAMQAFLDEATRTRAIAHPSVVRVLDFGVDGDDCYLVMERLDGETLAAQLARVHRLDEPEVRRLGAAVADGVAAAHARGIVHRDLKPGNIMLVAGEPPIVDFGIARSFSRAASTVTGSRLGTPAYMAPEQLAGGLVAPCVDVWALGVILYEALAGRLPFDDFTGGRTPQLVDVPPRLGALVAVSPTLEALIDACLQREPGKRPASMQAIADALRGPAGELRVTEEVPPPRRAASTAGAVADRPAGESPRRRRPVRTVAVVAALAAVVAFGIGWALRSPTKAGDGLIAAPAPPTVAASKQPPETPMTVAPPAPAMASRDVVTLGAGSGAGSAAAPPDVAAPPPAGQPVAANPSVSATSPTGFTVELRSAPTGADIIVGGNRVGATPATIALGAPSFIMVVHPGYRPLRVRAVRAGAFDVRLVPVHRPPARRPAAGETLD